MKSSSTEFEPAGLAGSPDSGNLRPTERVVNYLMAEMDRQDAENGSRLPSVRQLAQQLNVSAATVQNVYRRFSKTGRIRSEVGNGRFLIVDKATAKSSYNIGLNVPVPGETEWKEAMWAFKIYGGILYGMLQSPVPVMIRSLPLSMQGSEESWEHVAAASRELDGLIIYPFLYSRRLRALYLKEDRPAVYLNPPDEEATVNFVSPDYYGASRRLGEAWVRTGRRRIAIVVHPEMEESVSVRLRCNGLLAGLGTALGAEIAARVFTVPTFKQDSGYAGLKRAMTEGFVPDAVYCAGDPLALGALQALREAGLKVPEEVSVVGGSGIGGADAIDEALTSIVHPLEQIGNTLIAMLMTRIANQAEDTPGVYHRTTFYAGKTTRPEENALLEQSNAPD